MRHRVLPIVAVCLSCVSFGTVRASADPIVVTGGQLTNLFTASQFVFTGDGFSLSAMPQFGLVSPMFLNCRPCRADRPVSLSFDATSLGGSWSSGLPGVFDGVSYERTFLEGSIFLEGPEFTSAALSPGNLVFTAPFTMTATVRNYDSSPRSGEPLFTASLIGSGTATARFSTVGDGMGGTLFDAVSVTYEFAPTPEPGSLLLLTTGIALVARRLRTQRDHP